MLHIMMVDRPSGYVDGGPDGALMRVRLEKVRVFGAVAFWLLLGEGRVNSDCRDARSSIVVEELTAAP
jgi:hypothetical protein